MRHSAQTWPSGRGHLATDGCGLLSDLPRKSIEPIALAAGMAVLGTPGTVDDRAHDLYVS